MTKSSGGGGWRTGGGNMASIFTVRNTKSFRLNNVILLLHVILIKIRDQELAEYFFRQGYIYMIFIICIKY